MSDGLFDLLYIINSVITSTMKIFIIVLLIKIIIGFKRNCNLLSGRNIKWATILSMTMQEIY